MWVHPVHRGGGPGGFVPELPSSQLDKGNKIKKEVPVRQMPPFAKEPHGSSLHWVPREISPIDCPRKDEQR